MKIYTLIRVLELDSEDDPDEFPYEAQWVDLIIQNGKVLKSRFGSRFKEANDE